MSGLSKVEQAILCLLLHPNIANEIEISDPLLRQPELDIQTFGSIWRYFLKNPTKNLGHFIGSCEDRQQTEIIYALLNHSDAHTKSKILDAKQEVMDMITEKEKKLGLNSAIERLKSKGKETINNPRDREEVHRIMEQIRKKKQ